MNWDQERPSASVALSAPAEPYPGYMDRLLSRVQVGASQAEPLDDGGSAGADAGLSGEVAARAGVIAPRLIELSDQIHRQPELCFEEHQSARAAVRTLERLGFDVELGSFGMPTSFRASAGLGRGPRVVIFAEYDALPDIGHACGHNIICAAAVGAFATLASHAEHLSGTVELIGSPAEEGGGGKEVVVQSGGLDGVDAALMVHPFSFDLAEHPMLGLDRLVVRFEGRAAHAAASPFLGRNALDAVVLAYSGVSQLRQHLLPGDRVHGVISEGGTEPNVVPERTSATFYLRSASPEGLAELRQRMVDVVEAAALSTGTALELTWGERPYAPVRHNAPLVRRFAHHMRTSAGRRMLPRGVFPEEMTGSTDMGNVSVRVPAIHPLLAVSPPAVSTHSPAFTEWAIGPRAEAAVVDGARALALTTLDLMHDAALLAAVRADFAAHDL